MFWYDVDMSLIQKTTVRGRLSFTYQGLPFRFQIPTGVPRFGLSQYNSLQVSMPRDFVEWFRQLEQVLCPLTPFASNIKYASLQMKVDDLSVVFDHEGNALGDAFAEGYLKGEKVVALIEIPGCYFYNKMNGITIRAVQLKKMKS